MIFNTVMLHNPHKYEFTVDIISRDSDLKIGLISNACVSWASLARSSKYIYYNEEGNLLEGNGNLTINMVEQKVKDKGTTKIIYDKLSGTILFEIWDGKFQAKNIKNK